MVHRNIVLEIKPIPRQSEIGYVKFIIEKLENKTNKVLNNRIIEYLKMNGIKEIILPKEKY